MMLRSGSIHCASPQSGCALSMYSSDIPVPVPARGRRAPGHGGRMDKTEYAEAVRREFSRGMGPPFFLPRDHMTPRPRDVTGANLCPNADPRTSTQTPTQRGSARSDDFGKAPRKPQDRFECVGICECGIGRDAGIRTRGKTDLLLRKSGMGATMGP